MDKMRLLHFPPFSSQCTLCCITFDARLMCCVENGLGQKDLMDYEDKNDEPVIKWGATVLNVFGTIAILW